MTDNIRILFNDINDIDKFNREIVENVSGQSIEDLDIVDINQFLTELMNFHLQTTHFEDS